VDNHGRGRACPCHDTPKPPDASSHGSGTPLRGKSAWGALSHAIVLPVAFANKVFSLYTWFPGHRAVAWGQGGSPICSGTSGRVERRGPCGCQVGVVGQRGTHAIGNRGSAYQFPLAFNSGPALLVLLP